MCETNQYVNTPGIKIYLAIADLADLFNHRFVLRNVIDMTACLSSQMPLPSCQIEISNKFIVIRSCKPVIALSLLKFKLGHTTCSFKQIASR